VTLSPKRTPFEVGGFNLTKTICALFDSEAPDPPRIGYSSCACLGLTAERSVSREGRRRHHRRRRRNGNFIGHDAVGSPFDPFLGVGTSVTFAPTSSAFRSTSQVVVGREGGALSSH